MKTLEEEIQQPKFENEFIKAFINLSFTNNHFTDLSKKIFKSYKLTAQQFNVLRILKGVYPKSKTTGEVKEVMIDKSPDLTRLVDRLIAKNLVERENCPIDRRQVNLKIKTKGIELIEMIEPEMRNFNTFLESISEKEAKTLNHILDKWRG